MQGIEQYGREIESGLTEPVRFEHLISAAQLERKEISPMKWGVRGLIPAGLTILASPPKYGKSWLALALCLAVAQCEDFLGFPTEKSEVLYLALEDSERRLLDRQRKLLNGKSAPESLTFATEAHTTGEGLFEQLNAFTREHPKTGLVVIDTLQKVRSWSGSSNAYAADYAEVAKLKKFADKHQLVLLLVHHLRKMEDSDPFARISGTNGISGAADTMLVLTREKRGDALTTLSVTGRDVDTMELSLSFRDGTWKNMGSVAEIQTKQERDDYESNLIAKTIRRIVEVEKDGEKKFYKSKDLLDAGQIFFKTDIADSPRALSSKLTGLESSLQKFDGIRFERKSHGSGGVYRFFQQ
ncbi:MAG: helicase RepA family protein [Oscillospiraceae bacterium]|nr:helicase RepA family protein [Oscillospiraceae bacterium]